MSSEGGAASVGPQRSASWGRGQGAELRGLVVSSHSPFFFVIFFYVKEIRNKVQEHCCSGEKSFDFRETRMPFLLPEADMSKAGVIIATHDSAYGGDVEIIFLNHCYFSCR